MRCWLTSGKITLIGSLLTVAGRIAPYSCWADRSLQLLGGALLTVVGQGAIVRGHSQGIG
ncbi:MAG: hypothetical protein HQL03_07285 [Nitrospirae bacterium]|nr:hypothetical protein [Nitrospirota bacterium]